LLSFELAQPDDCLPFINRLQIPVKGTGLADTRSLVIPVAHTIFWEAGAAVRAQMGIGDGLIRYSVGLEDLADLQADLAQALGAAA
jgi:O-acetylhomoserine (thiol)-lyase